MPSWRLGGVAVLAVCASLLGAACGGAGRMDAKALAEHSKAVQSLAAEGALLAEDSAAGRSTGVYLREHSADLSTAAAEAQSSLQGASPAPGLGPKLRELTAVATSIRGELERLGHASRQEQRALRRALEAAARASERIGAELE
jgi:hypothetical protein